MLCNWEGSRITWKIKVFYTARLLQINFSTKINWVQFVELWTTYKNFNFKNPPLIVMVINHSSMNKRTVSIMTYPFSEKSIAVIGPECPGKLATYFRSFKSQILMELKMERKSLLILQLIIELDKYWKRKVIERAQILNKDWI